MQHDIYTMTLTAKEYRSLGWVADRYISAEVLYDLPTWEDDDETGETISARLIGAHGWAFTGALIAHEDHDPGRPNRVPPCVGGSLADKIDAWLTAWEAVHGDMIDMD